jgi:hypothetical protein
VTKPLAEAVSAVAEQTSAATEQVSASAQESSASTTQIGSSIDEPAQMAAQLAELVGSFTVYGSAAHRLPPQFPRRRSRAYPQGVPAAGSDDVCRAHRYVDEMEHSPVQILEVRAGEGIRAVTITLAVSEQATHAILIALVEQLDRRRAAAVDTVEDVLALRDQSALVERFEPLASAGAHAVVSLTDTELRACLLELTAYADRVDGEHFQPAELRGRLGVIGEITAVLWDANAAAAAAAEPLTEATPFSF